MNKNKGWMLFQERLDLVYEQEQELNVVSGKTRFGLWTRTRAEWSNYSGLWKACRYKNKNGNDNKVENIKI